MASLFKQTVPLLTMGLSTISKRKGSSGVIVLGIAGAVAVLISVLAIAVGLGRTMAGTGNPDTAILLSTGADGETASEVGQADYDTIASLPEVAKGADGKPLASAEIVTVFPVISKDSGDEGNVSLRGIGPQGLALNPGIRIVAGRSFHPGLREVIAGSNVVRQFRGFGIGDRIHVGNSVWTVTGYFESHDVHDSEVLADVDTVQSAMDMGGYYNAIYTRLQSADRFQAFKDEVEHNPAMHLEVQTESQYFAAQSRDMTQAITSMAYFVGVIMAIGALFGAIHSLYISADMRKTEMATLRAIGFGAGSVLLSFLLEALVLALAGGCIGGFAAWLLFNGHTASTLNGHGGAQVVFQLHVSPHLIASGVIWACSIGFLGALIPAIRGARLQVADALRG